MSWWLIGRAEYRSYKTPIIYVKNLLDRSLFKITITMCLYLRIKIWHEQLEACYFLMIVLIVIIHMKMGFPQQTRIEKSYYEIAHKNNLRRYNVYSIIYKAKRYVIINLAMTLCITIQKSYLTIFI
jgi:hypothetical protein